MSQDDRPGDAPTEWLSPALYRQLCDAVDAALYAPPEAREGLLAARLGSDQRLLAEARALLASHEASPHTIVTPMSAPGGNDATFVGRPGGSDETFVGRPGGSDETFIGRPDSNATIIRRESATVIVPGSGSRPAYDPSAAAADGTQEMAALASSPPSSGTATIPSPLQQSPPAPPPMPAPFPPPVKDPLAATTPGVPRPVARTPEPPAPTPEPTPVPMPPPLASRPASRPAVPVADPVPPPVAEPLPPPAGPAHVRGVDLGVPAAVRSSGTSIAGYLAWIVAIVALAGSGIAVWMLLGARAETREAQLRVAQAERRFTEVRQLGKRLAEVDRLLAVTADPGAQAARAVLVKTWMQYLTDLQRASGSTEKELLFEVAKGYRQLAAAQGGISGRTLGDRANAAKTLQIGERLLIYLDANSGDPNREILQELIATQVDLGDLYAVGKDTVASTEKYRRALAAAERLGAAGVSAADVKRQTDVIRQRIQSGPPAAAPATVDAAPVGAAEQP